MYIYIYIWLIFPCWLFLEAKISVVGIVGIVGIFHANHRQEEVFWTTAVATQLKVNVKCNALKDFADQRRAAMVGRSLPLLSFERPSAKAKHIALTRETRS